MKRYDYFDLRPNHPECCEACHEGLEGHCLVGVQDLAHETLGMVCDPVAERLRALGYLFDGPRPLAHQLDELAVELGKPGWTPVSVERGGELVNGP